MGSPAEETHVRPKFVKVKSVGGAMLQGFLIVQQGAEHSGSEQIFKQAGGGRRVALHVFVRALQQAGRVVIRTGGFAMCLHGADGWG